jgi:hypothetical protein
MRRGTIQADKWSFSGSPGQQRSGQDQRAVGIPVQAYECQRNVRADVTRGTAIESCYIVSSSKYTRDGKEATGARQPLCLV